MRQAAFSGHSPASHSHPCEPQPLWRVAVFGLDLSNAYLLANRGYSSGAAEVATKNVAGCWSNALNESGRFDVDAPNDDQCELLDVGAPSYDQCEQFDAPNDSRCTPSESVVASPEAFELTDPVCSHLDPLCPVSPLD